MRSYFHAVSLMQGWKRYRSGAFVVLGAALLLAGAGVAAAQTTPSTRPPDSITVTGSATVSAPPDQAVISGSVQTQAETSAAAADQNSRTFQAVLDSVRALGVEDKDIQTAGFSVSPQYSYTQPQPGEASRPPVVVGYQASNSLTVTTKQLDQASRILQAMANAGATNLSGPSYQLQHPELLQIQAEQQAAANALQRAQAIASGLGVRLGGVQTANEGGVGLLPVAPPVPRPATVVPSVPNVLPSFVPVAPPPVVAPSSLSASARVTVVFTIINAGAGSGSSGP